ncbi:MAG: hypothetical protein M1828_005039 [Chrysothrix sp. TS-e1954]|nr:MAG: hypothetical protein M1828_005039 [Chrysothrix sp. TS-e1954]
MPYWIPPDEQLQHTGEQLQQSSNQFQQSSNQIQQSGNQLQQSGEQLRPWSSKDDFVRRSENAFSRRAQAVASAEEAMRRLRGTLKGLFEHIDLAEAWNIQQHQCLYDTVIEGTQMPRFAFLRNDHHAHWLQTKIEELEPISSGLSRLVLELKNHKADQLDLRERYMNTYSAADTNGNLRRMRIMDYGQSCEEVSTRLGHLHEIGLHRKLSKENAELLAGVSSNQDALRLAKFDEGLPGTSLRRGLGDADATGHETAARGQSNTDGSETA